ncbi:hypothetical protein Q8F55_006291 [Vanrija albida]|uniref:HD/PDEase domain-containing protein n=1 Tax=Vanrija albida TaxID=181172 RepID=A0ABR3PXI8_9TREE
MPSPAPAPAPDLPLAHLAPPTTAVRTGHFQTLHPSPTSALITDAIHGAVELAEPVLLDLLAAPAVRRLAGVHQHGVTGLLGHTARVTRLEHSVGAMLLVRRAGGGLEEQVAALLHDVSHTVLSHVVDCAFPPGARGSFHEDEKERYVATTSLPALLRAHGLDPSAVLDEEAYPLVERPAPHLCADRLDYGLRDAAAFGVLSVADARATAADVLAYPSATAADRTLALRDPGLALALARAYAAADAAVWANPSFSALYVRTGAIIAAMVADGRVRDAELWALSDEQFWQTLKERASAEEQAELRDIEGVLPPPRRLEGSAKIRTLDPDVVVPGGLVPLSTVRPEWAAEREAYIAKRRAEPW